MSSLLPTSSGRIPDIHRQDATAPSLKRTLKNNSLTLVLLALFAFSWLGQALTGHRQYNHEREDHHLSAVSFPHYLTSGHFWQATAENWESEFLQMGMFVVLTVFLYQKGSPESKDPDCNPADEPCNENPADHRNDPNAPWPVRRGGLISALYSSSLSLTLFALFAVSFAVHAIKGAQSYNEQLAAQGQPTETVLQYLADSRFWFESLQNWQSEFLSIAAMVYLAVYLRQKHSPESKPVHVSHDAQE